MSDCSFTLLGRHAALFGNELPTFRDSLSVPFQGSISSCFTLEDER